MAIFNSYVSLLRRFCRGPKNPSISAPDGASQSPMDVDGGAGSTAGTASPEPSGLGETLSVGAKGGELWKKTCLIMCNG